jgi:hypothetical protein
MGPAEMKLCFSTRSVNCCFAVLAWPLLVAILPIHFAAKPAGLFDLTMHLSQQEVEIAEPVELTIRATAPPGWQILPLVMPAEWQGLRVIGSSETTEQRENQTVWTRHVKLEAYEAGRKTILPVEVTFAPPRLDHEVKAGKVEPRKLKSAASVLWVRSALGLFESGTELRPIYDTVSVPWTWRQWTVAAGCAALIVACGLLVIRWVNRFHDDPGSISAQFLLRELVRLRESWLRDRQSDAATVVAASEIARRWLRWRQGAVMTHRTTGDWAAVVRHWKVAAIAPVVDVLSLADRVKFAQAEPTVDEVRDCLERLRQVMQVARERSK